MKYSWLAFILLPALLSCAAQPTFKPEVEGDGAVLSKGGVVYSIPEKNPVIKMKLVSMVIPKDSTVHVRIYFVRKGPPADEYLDPKEQSLTLVDSQDQIYPTSVYASGAGKPLIRLAQAPTQAIELVFPVPKAGGHQYPYITLNWKIHYKQNKKDLTMSQAVRFDYVSKNIPQSGVGQYQDDLEFPSGDAFLPFEDRWLNPGFMWW